jgi:predicted nucleic acid-binding Zn ribbon protein
VSDDHRSSPDRSASAEPAGTQPDREMRGPDLARAALEAARASGRTPSGRRRAAREGQEGAALDGEPRRRRGFTGAGPDPRDPQPFGGLIRRMVAARGWERPEAAATVLGSWDRVAGAEVAAHCEPVGLRDGELTLQAESTAWATQLRLLTPTIMARIREHVGPGVVTKLRIHGPAAPSWKRGTRSVQGRGPRDTYG